MAHQGPAVEDPVLKIVGILAAGILSIWGAVFTGKKIESRRRNRQAAEDDDEDARPYGSTSRQMMNSILEQMTSFRTYDFPLFKQQLLEKIDERLDVQRRELHERLTRQREEIFRKISALEDRISELERKS